MISINQIVNFDLHPINMSSDYLNACKQQLKKNSILQLDNFLLTKSLTKIQNAVSLQRKDSYSQTLIKRRAKTWQRLKKDWPEDHRKKIQESVSVISRI